ncbi:outer membrane lipoprotein carrier protein LolA [Aquicoccus sp. SCR17]|nr:outer membrane lipoprotein carrier protein LolA [Carideicomes alvinocaridis]
MIRRLLAPVLLCLLALPAAAQELSLNQISAYLNSIGTAKAQFTQVNEDGTISKGTIFIKRPGRVRFEYDPPNDSLVVASGGEVLIVDPKSNTPPESYPLSRTPLSIILAQNVDLSRANMVTGKDYDGTATTVTAQDPQHPEYGRIKLKFTGPTPQLRQWVITNESGSQTTVVLGELQTGVGINNSMFRVREMGSNR